MKHKSGYGMLQNIRWIIKTAWSTRKSVPILYAVLALLAVVRSLLEIFIAPQILNKVEQKAAPSSLLMTVFGFTAAVFLLSVIYQYIAKNSKYARFDVRAHILEKVMEKTHHTSYPNTLKAEFQKYKYGSEVALDEPIPMIWDSLSQLLASMVGFLVYLFLLRDLPPVLLICVVVTCVAGFFIARKTDTYREHHQEEEAGFVQKCQYVEYTAQSLELAKEIRLFGLMNWLNDIIRSTHNLYYTFYHKAESYRLIGGIADALLTIARNGICYYVLIAEALAGKMSASQFLLYFSAATGFTAWITEILRQTADLRSKSLHINSLRSFLEYPEPFRFSGGIELPDVDTYELTMEDVSFHYPNMEDDIISHMNLTIHAGEKLAIVGLNGAGKTTMVLLLCGLLDPTGGRVMLNGHDIREFNRREYYCLFSAVFQKYGLLRVSFADEISLDPENTDREKVRQCLEEAQLWGKVSALPHGMDTHTNHDIWEDGIQLSGGEIQRLLLARALYRNAPILLLDEPTAALDPLAESELYQRYLRMTAGKTAVFISHRLASTRFCDRVLFLQNGQILEEGTHESLLKAGGQYAHLFDVQSRYYREGRDF